MWGARGRVFSGLYSPPCSGLFPLGWGTLGVNPGAPVYDGLSPLARGTLDERCRLLREERFIPAGAGNTPPACHHSQCQAVYPRWRGEHGFSLPARLYPSGLSPLARGTQFHNLPIKPGERFIPAGAGNTMRYFCLKYLSAVYPRWRGEHNAELKPPTLDVGLSPLARGTLARTPPAAGLVRFIPAGAGNTLCYMIPVPIDTVYPRWRGEHLVCSKQIDREIGLSPLARGTL